jgi:hypothetical protein
MYQGGQTVAMTERGATQASEPPQMVFEGLKRDGKTFSITSVANVFNLDAGETVLDTTKSVEVQFRNQGKGPLELTLLSTSCGCLHTVEVDGQKLVTREYEGQHSATVHPGKEGVIKLSWSPEEKNAASPKLLIGIEILTNDPQFRDPLRLELTSKLIRAPKEGKS